MIFYENFIKKLSSKKFQLLTQNIKNNLNILFKNLNTKTELFEKRFLFLDKYYKYFFVIFIVLFYLIFQQLFETGMGGDDGRFYIFYPTKNLEGLVKNHELFILNAPNNIEYSLNTVYVFSVLEKVGFGYKDFYFLIFFLGFYFFYLSLKEIKKYYNFEGPLSNYFIFFLSLLYPSNPLTVNYVWNIHWASIFTIIGTPLVFLVFLKLIFKTLKFIEIIIFNLLFTGLSLYFANLVQVQVTLFFLIGFTVIYLIFKKSEYLFFFTRAFLLVIFFLLLNFSWFYKLFNTFGNSSFSPSTHVDILKGFFEYYKTLSQLEYLFLGASPESNFLNGDITYYASFYLFAVLFVVGLLCLIYNFYISYLLKKGVNDFVVIGLLLSFLIVGYLQTITLTDVGSNIFIFLSKFFYSLNGFRNYVNKTATIYSLIPLSIVLVSYILFFSKKAISKVLSFVVVIFFSLISLRELVLIKDYKFMLPEGYKRATSFDQETKDLIKNLESNEVQRTIFFPLGEAPYDIVKNESNKDIYFGISPIFSFLGIDNINQSTILDGVIYHTKLTKLPSFQTSFDEMSIEEIMFKIKFLGVNKIVFNNEIDLSTTKLWMYPVTDKYRYLKQELEKNYVKDFESSNKRFSVYHIENNLIQFKNSLYKLDENTDFDFYSLDYENSTFTFDTLPKQNLNFYVSNQKNSNHYHNYPIDKFLSKYNQLIEMKVRNSSNFPAFNTTDKLYVLNVSGDNLLRIALSSPKNYVSVRAAVDGSGATCLSRLFGNIKECEMFKDIQPEKVNGNYVYTVKFEETAPGNMYILFKNNNPDEFKTEEINPVFYTADVSQLKYNPFSEEERLRYLDKYFVKNELSVEYQIPKTIDSSRVSAGVYKVKVELEDRKLPLILVLKNQYSPNWIVEGSFIEKQSRFNSDGMFNGWVIQPNGKSDTLELTIKLKQNKYEDLIKNLNSNFIVLCLLIVGGYGVYFVVKKYKRLGKLPRRS